MRAIDADALRERLQSLAYDDWNQGVTTSFADACHEIIDVVEDQPTIEPERKTGKWIPCSERLPDIGKPVLLSEPNDMMIAEYYGNGLPEGVWIVDGIHHYLASIAVCAWMPLPEPYNGGKQDG